MSSCRSDCRKGSLHQRTSISVDLCVVTLSFQNLFDLLHVSVPVDVCDCIEIGCRFSISGLSHHGARTDLHRI